MGKAIFGDSGLNGVILGPAMKITPGWKPIDRFAVYSGGSGSDTLTFLYIVKRVGITQSIKGRNEGGSRSAIPAAQYMYFNSGAVYIYTYTTVIPTVCCILERFGRRAIRRCSFQPLMPVKTTSTLSYVCSKYIAPSQDNATDPLA